MKYWEKKGFGDGREVLRVLRCIEEVGALLECIIFILYNWVSKISKWNLKGFLIKILMVLIWCELEIK